MIVMVTRYKIIYLTVCKSAVCIRRTPSLSEVVSSYLCWSPKSRRSKKRCMCTKHMHTRDVFKGCDRSCSYLAVPGLVIESYSANIERWLTSFPVESNNHYFDEILSFQGALLLPWSPVMISVRVKLMSYYAFMALLILKDQLSAFVITKNLFRI